MVGIDISDKSIKIVEITDGVSRKLRTVCWSPLALNVMRRGIIQDIPMAASALREAMVRCSPVPVAGKEVTASIPETQSFVRVLELPNMSDREMDEAVQWAVRQHIPFDLDRVYLNWQPLLEPSVDSQRRHVVVGAAQREVVDPLLQVLDNLELNVVALELEAQAIVRSLLPLDASGITGVVIVDLGATTTNVIFFDQGALRFTASVQVGGDDLTKKLVTALHLQPSLAAEKKALVGVGASSQDAQVAAMLRDSTLDLIRRVERVVREMIAQSSQNNTIRAILLSGGTANLPGIVDMFAEVFPGIPIQLGNPWTNLAVEGQDDNAPLSQADAAHFVTGIGLALRSKADVWN